MKHTSSREPIPQLAARRSIFAPSSFMASPPSLPSNFQINNADGITMKNNELKISSLYLHHAYREPSPTHLTILRPNSNNGFGTTVANNWTIYNGPDPSVDAIVAHAQGLHLQSGNWHNSFTIVFEIDWLKGSTLQVMGLGVERGDQWGIVSGTGKFTMAYGYINKKLHKVIDTGNIIELDIHAFFRTLKTNSNLIKEVPKGGSGGEYCEPTYEPFRLESIKIRHGSVIDFIEFTYVDEYGMKRTEQWGCAGGSKIRTVELGPDEFVQEIHGTAGKHTSPEKKQYDVVKTLKIVTNLQTFGPYGGEETAGTSTFILPENKDGTIVGFTGRSGRYLHAIGAIIRPSLDV